MTTTPTNHRRIDALLSERISRTLNERGSTVSWLAERTGVSERVLHSRLAGNTEFTVGELGAIATALGCGWGSLVEHHEIGGLS